jgi:hypothetical protein
VPELHNPRTLVDATKRPVQDDLLAVVLRGLKRDGAARDVVADDDLWGDLPSLIAEAEAFGAEEDRRDRKRALKAEMKRGA